VTILKNLKAIFRKVKHHVRIWSNQLVSQFVSCMGLTHDATFIRITLLGLPLCECVLIQKELLKKSERAHFGGKRAHKVVPVHSHVPEY
jgi:hypothetical protein